MTSLSFQTQHVYCQNQLLSSQLISCFCAPSSDLACKEKQHMLQEINKWMTRWKMYVIFQISNTLQETRESQTIKLGSCDKDPAYSLDLNANEWYIQKKCDVMFLSPVNYNHLKITSSDAIPLTQWQLNLIILCLKCSNKHKVWK